MSNDDSVRRDQIRGVLSSGLGTEAFPRGDTHEQVQWIVQRLRNGKKDLATKLVIGGFTLSPVDHNDIRQSCQSCMYYLIRRRYCALPELDVPVEPDWSCRLWRI
jgi:hypothetical protein